MVICGLLCHVSVLWLLSDLNKLYVNVNVNYFWKTLIYFSCQACWNWACGFWGALVYVNKWCYLYLNYSASFYISSSLNNKILTLFYKENIVFANTKILKVVFFTEFSKKNNHMSFSPMFWFITTFYVNHIQSFEKDQPIQWIHWDVEISSK